MAKLSLIRHWPRQGFSVWRRLTVTAAIAGALIACSKGDREQTLREAASGPAPSALREGKAPGILLITVDTLRPDHLGIYGYPRRTSPNLDRWFADGAVFSPAYSTETHTAPSVVSILSGRYPQAHGVRMFFQLLPSDTLLLTDRLPSDYQTAAFVSNCALTDEAIGMAKRFDYYDDFVDEKEPYRLVYERNARRTTDAVLRWLEEYRDRSRPVFLWVHYIDPHGPYHPPDDRQLSFTHATPVPIDVERIPHWVREPSVTDGLDYVDAYDEEIAFLDVHMGRLLEAFSEAFDRDRSYMLFSADHGESMMEHEQWFMHGYHVYEELVRVPLMMRGPGIEAGRRRGPASGIDLVPTILGMAGVRVPADLPGLDLRRNEIIESGRIVFAEASYSSLHWRAAIGTDSKWLVKLNGGQRSVLETLRYDLTVDTREIQPLEGQPEDDALRELLRLVRHDPDPGGAPVRPERGSQLRGPKIASRADAQALEELRALGYVN